jgi:hypothetical protein
MGKNQNNKPQRMMRRILSWPAALEVHEPPSLTDSTFLQPSCQMIPIKSLLMNQHQPSSRVKK